MKSKLFGQRRSILATLALITLLPVLSGCADRPVTKMPGEASPPSVVEAGEAAAIRNPSGAPETPEPPDSPTLPEAQHQPGTGEPSNTANTDQPASTPDDAQPRPYSPYPSELPHSEPMPGDENYVAPISDMDFSVPGIYEVEENMTYSVDLDGDGVLKPLTIGDRYRVWIEYNGKSLDVSCEVMSYGAIMRREDGSAAMFISSNDYDYPITKIFTVKDGALTQVDRIDLVIVELGFDSMKVYGAIYYFLGNQFLYGTVGLSDSYAIIYPEDDFFEVEWRTYMFYPSTDGVPAYDPNGFDFTLLIDLTLRQIVEDEYVPDVLRAGTRIRPLKINLGLTCAIIESDDGRQWLLVPDEDYPQYILDNEKCLPDDLVFDGCIFAGP